MRLLADEFDSGLGDGTGCGDQARDRVDEGGLARAVGSDQEAQVSLQECEVHSVDGVEAVEGDSQIADFEVVAGHAGVAAVDGCVHRAGSNSVVAAGTSSAGGAGRDRRRRRHTVASPARPAGKKPTTTMNSSP